MRDRKRTTEVLQNADAASPSNPGVRPRSDGRGFGMERTYRLMYRLGLTPWDDAAIPAEISRLVQGSSALPAGVALDIGCGTGRHAAFLADHGWEVTALDAVALAIQRAQARSKDVHWFVAEIGAPSMREVIDPLRGTVTLILDVGCLHGLDPAGRHAWGLAVNQAAAPGAVLLLRAGATRTRRSITPRGIAAHEVAHLLGSTWTLTRQSGADWSTYTMING